MTIFGDTRQHNRITQILITKYIVITAPNVYCQPPVLGNVANDTEIESRHEDGRKKNEGEVGGKYGANTRSCYYYRDFKEHFHLINKHTQHRTMCRTEEMPNVKECYLVRKMAEG